MFWRPKLKTKQYLVLAILWTIIILIGVGIPGNQIPKVSKFIDLFQPDKIVHLCLFAPFSFLWLSYFSDKIKSRKRSIFLVLFIGLVFAILTELLQFYVFIGRSANIPDAIADVIGVLLGIYVYIKKTNKYRKVSKILE